jgi:XTP/dITP diphosphohydrolase
MQTNDRKILIATRNRGKVKEISALVKGLPIEFVSLADFPDIPEVVEDGETFEENALKKARFVSAATGLPTLADDSGLCVDALNGRPGVHSARYAGPQSSDQDKYMKLLEEMKGVADHLRAARFVCVLALVSHTGEEHIFRGVCEGRITHEPAGDGGFGYDPIFFYEEAERTFGEMPRAEKNEVSHRGLALLKFAEFCRTRMG